MIPHKNVFVMTAAFISIMLLIVARHHPPSRRKIKQIWHGRVYWESNTTMLRRPALNVSEAPSNVPSNNIKEPTASVSKSDDSSSKNDASISKNDASISKNDASISKNDASISKSDDKDSVQVHNYESIHALLHSVHPNACTKHKILKGDNSKEPDVHVCMDNITPPCVVYSFGIANNWIFDDFMISQGCHVFSFDPSMNVGKHKRHENHLFEPIGIGSKSGRHDGPTTLINGQTNYDVLTLGDIMKRYNHERVTLVRMDTEYAEWDVLQQWKNDNMFSKIDQLLLEIHMWPKSTHRNHGQLHSEILHSIPMTLFHEAQNKWDNNRLAGDMTRVYEVGFLASKSISNSQSTPDFPYTPTSTYFFKELTDTVGEYSKYSPVVWDMDCWPHYPTYGGSETNFVSGTRAKCRKINEKKFCEFLDTMDKEKTYVWINQFSDFDSETRPWDKCRRSNIYYTYISFGKTKHPNDIPVPTHTTPNDKYPKSAAENEHRCNSAKLDVSFRGQAKTPLRKKMLTFNSNIKNAKFEVENKFGSTSKRMFELLENSKFGLVPRGHAMFSYRLMETMAMGVVPIIISDGWQLPFEDMLDWSEFSIRVREDDISTLSSVIEAHRDRACEMSAKVYDVYHKYMATPKAIVEAIDKQIGLYGQKMPLDTQTMRYGKAKKVDEDTRAPKDINNAEVHVAFSTDKWSEGFNGALRTLDFYVSKPVRVHIVVPTVDTRIQIQKKLDESFMKNMKFSYYILPVVSVPLRPVQSRLTQKITWGTLLLNKMLSPNIKRVLCLDTDILIHTDIVPLFETKVANIIAGVFQDEQRVRSWAKMSEFPENQKMLNSGVILMDLDAWRNNNMDDFVAHSMETLKHNNDQTIFNFICAKYGCGKLEKRWNIYNLGCGGERKSDSLIRGIYHWSCHRKWWKKDGRNIKIASAILKEIEQKKPKPNVIITSWLASEWSNKGYKAMLENRKAYARKHGYTFLDFNETNLPTPELQLNYQQLSHYIKQPLILAVMEDCKPEDWVIWMDTDTMFTNDQKKWEEYLSGDMVFAEAPDVITNNGIFALRCNDWGRFFIRLWSEECKTMNTGGRLKNPEAKAGDNAPFVHALLRAFAHTHDINYDNHCRQENGWGALVRCYNRQIEAIAQESGLARTRGPNGELGSGLLSDPHITGVWGINSGLGFQPPNDWHEGDFILHFAGKSERDRDTLGLKYSAPIKDTLTEKTLFPTVFDSCAVVGSSSVLIDNLHGKDIDSHDAVFRSNFAPVDGYQKDAGSRTTVRVCNKVGISKHFKKCREQDPSTSYVITKLDYSSRKKYDREFNLIAQQNLGSSVIEPSYDFFKKLHKDIYKTSKNTELTSGAIMFAVALQMCSGKISVYGFDSESVHKKRRKGELKNLRSHYYDNTRPAGGYKGTPHRFSMDSAFICGHKRSYCHVNDDYSPLAFEGKTKSIIDLDEPPAGTEKTLFPTVFDSCAIVGSSSVLIDNLHGKDIDSHDAVFRSNFAPVDGYQKDVGSRTTVRICNKVYEPRHFLKCLEQDPSTKYYIPKLLYNTRKKYDKDFKWLAQQKLKQTLMTPSYEFLKKTNKDVYKTSKHVELSSGTLMFVVALQMCSGKISVYGFDSESVHKKRRKGELKNLHSHYYDNLQPASGYKGTSHKFSMDTAFVCGHKRSYCHVNDDYSPLAFEGRIISTQKWCTIEELAIGNWEYTTTKLDEPFSFITNTGQHRPQKWVTNCKYNTYNAEKASKILSRHSTMIVGDSTQLGVYDEIKYGVMTDYTFEPYKGILPAFHRIDKLNMQTVDKILSVVGDTTAIIINVGAHEAKSERFRCPYDVVDYLETKQFYDINVTTFSNNKNFEFSKEKTLAQNGECFRTCQRAAQQVQEVWLKALTKLRNHYHGAIIFRTIQINFGFNKRGHENCIKLQINKWLRSTPEFGKLNIRVLDIEKMTGSRPETFVHENTNHFYCQCNSGVSKVQNRCKTKACLSKRTSVFENGEPNRYMAQLYLYALEGLPLQVNNKILHANNRIIKYNCATTIYMVLNNDYFENGAVMLHSLKRHLNMKYCIKILYSKTLPNANLEESSKSKLCQHLGICDFINIKTQWQKIVKLKNIKAYPALLALNTFDDNSSDIVLFLDADMLVIRDFSNIFEKLSDDYVHGSAPTKEQKYINTGFFCMTRGFLAKQNRTRQIQSFITEKDLLSNKINRLGDQDIINRVFPVINHEWYVNYRPKKNKDIEKFNIIHWSGMIKPNKSPGVFRTNQKGPSIMNDLWKKERNMLNWL